jgi:hypothetical protein
MSAIKGTDGYVVIGGKKVCAVNEWVIPDPVVIGDIVETHVTASIFVDVETYKQMCGGDFVLQIEKKTV